MSLVIKGHTSRVGIQTGNNPGLAAQYRSPGEFAAADKDRMLAPALRDMAQGLDQLAGAAYQRQQAKQQLDLINDVQGFRASAQEFMDDYQMNNQGADGVNAEQAFLEWNQEQANALKQKYQGSVAAQTYLAQHAGAISASGLNSMRDYGNRQLKVYEEQTYEGLQSQRASLIFSDPANYEKYVNDMVGQYEAFYARRGTSPELIRANRNLIRTSGFEQAFNGALANGDAELAADIIRRAYSAKPEEGVSGGADFSQAAPGTPRVSGARFALPTDAHHHITSPFGTRSRPKDSRTGRLGSRNHQGIDLRVPKGTPIKAISGGEIAFAGNKGGYGIAVVIKHDDGTTTSQYGHLSKLNVKSGMRVNAGEVIALSGDTGISTGPHLDLKVTENGKYIDPAPLLGIAKGGKLTGQLERVGLAANAERGEAGQPIMLASLGGGPIGVGDSAVPAAGAETEEIIDVDYSTLRSAEDGDGGREVEQGRATPPEYGGLVPRGSLMKMQKALAEAQEREMKALHQNELDLLDQADLEGRLTPELVMGSRTLSREQKLKWLDVAEGKAGYQGYFKTQNKNLLENTLYAAIGGGDIYSADDLDRWYAADYTMNGEPLRPLDYFDRQDMERHKKEVLGQAQETAKLLKQFTSVNNNSFGKKKDDQALNRELFQEVALKSISDRRLRPDRDGEAIQKLLGELLVNDNYKKIGEGFGDEFGGRFMDRPGVMDSYVQRRISRAGLPDTEFNRLRARAAIIQNKPINEVMPPNAENWGGQGLMTQTLSGALRTYKSYFEAAGQSYNVDPNLLGAVAMAASRGERYALSTLRPGGVGLMQLGPDMTESLSDPEDPRENVFAAARRFREIMTETGDNLPETLARYAAGLEEKDRDKFVARVMELYDLADDPYSHLTTDSLGLPRGGRSGLDILLGVARTGDN